MPNVSIVMYARERFCPDVQRSRDRLAEHELNWTEHDIEAEPAAASEVEQLTGQRRVPTVMIGAAVLVEPSNEELDRALRNAGYEVQDMSRNV